MEDFGADINARDFEGKTPLFVAARDFLSDAVVLLIRNGANFEHLVHFGDNLGRNLIYMAARQNALDVMYKLSPFYEKSQIAEQMKIAALEAELLTYENLLNLVEEYTVDFREHLFSLSSRPNKGKLRADIAILIKNIIENGFFPPVKKMRQRKKLFSEKRQKVVAWKLLNI